MGIWIRSQDGKSLVIPQEIYIAKRAKSWDICTTRGVDIGKYSTKEKALKVLDIICEKIKIVEVMCEPVFYVPNKIFQMPKDEEV